VSLFVVDSGDCGSLDLVMNGGAVLNHTMWRCVLILVCLTACRQTPSQEELAASARKQIKRAQTQFDHGLVEDSKRTLLAVYFDESVSDLERAEALYWLSSFAIHEDRVDTAAEDLKRLSTEFKTTERGKQAAEMLTQLRPVLTSFRKDEVILPAASSLLRNGDFWSRDAHGFVIDSSWLPKEDMAAEWYDRVIRSFPRSSPAEEAYAKKIMALLGWEDRGVYSTTSFGAKRDFDPYISAATTTFQELQREFPESAYLQPLRYQIAQAYWSERKWDGARDWLNRVVAAKKTDGDFYAQAARNRLQKLKY
jgi:outer membrane protein assembly factor BamD (BamD/ComL family)